MFRSRNMMKRKMMTKSAATYRAVGARERDREGAIMMMMARR